jgi:hypothetical protein
MSRSANNKYKKAQAGRTGQFEQEVERKSQKEGFRMERLIGEVTSLKKIGGYCFLVGSDSRSYFLHVKNIRNNDVPAIGDLFTFSLRESPTKPGKQEAFDASLVERRSNKPRVVAPAPEVKL